MENLAKKNLSISIGILICIYLFQLLQAYMLHEMYYTLDYIFRAFGCFFTIIAIPLLVAIIAKLVFKKLFLGVFWKTLLSIAIPISLIAFCGDYQENSQMKGSNLGVKIAPRKYEPSPSELQDLEAKVQPQTFLKINQINEAIKRFPSNAIENSLYRISTRLFDHVKELTQVEQTINNMIQGQQYKSTDDLFLMSTLMHIIRSANAVIIGQMELLGVDPCVTQYKVFYSGTVNQSIKQKKSILYSIMLSMSELSKHISTKEILKFIDLSTRNINASIKLLDNALILTQKTIRDWAKVK